MRPAVRALLPLAVLTLAAARPAQAQRCAELVVWYVVRDEGGKVIAPAALDAPARVLGEANELIGGVPTVARVELPAQMGGDSAAALRFGSWRCKLQPAKVELARGGRRMRLDFGATLDLDEASLAWHEYVVELPPFAAGTYRLEWKPAVRPAVGSPVVRADRWVRVGDEDGG